MDTSMVEVPEFFICPISLQIMKDPVTTISGITYDRESIEYWLFKNHNTICPVTKQPLPRDSDLTPNHTLRRLIQAWCTVNAAYGIDRIPTPKPPLSKFYVLNLVRDLWLPNLQLKTLQKLEGIAVENDRNKIYLVEAGIVKALTSFIVSCHRKRKTDGLEEALSLFYLIRGLLGQEKAAPLSENEEIMDSLTWVLGFDGVLDHVALKMHAAYALKEVTKKTNSSTLAKLKPEFFNKIVRVLREGSSQQGINALLHVILNTCPRGRNRIMMIEAGAVFELIELELRIPEKKTTELILGILYHLCSCADGRAQLLNHAAGIAVITRRILKVSNTADDRAILIIALICKYSGTNGVLQEMLRVGTVVKLCMVLQADCASYLKDKAKGILRTHFDVWKDSPCIDLPTLTRYTR
ncbi:plant U-box 24 [Forsythia ovata]|uniref:U-box domain-containing protein n=1 Tax=Forsythia ovata TaxID=205694 RepID=A0ABD1SQV5_9LAMI